MSEPPPASPLRRPIVTVIVTIAVLAVTLWEFITYGTSPSVGELVEAGGITGPAWDALDVRAIVMANLLHANILHVVLNLFMLLIMGRPLEQAIGSLRTAAIVVAAVVGSSFGAAQLDPDTVSIGASGIGFALMGAAAVSDWRRETQLGPLAMTLLALNAVITFTLPDISIGGHLGGLVAGVAVAVLTGAPGVLHRRAPELRAAQAALLAEIERRERLERGEDDPTQAVDHGAAEVEPEAEIEQQPHPHAWPEVERPER